MGLLGSLTQQVQGPQRPGQQKSNVLFGTGDCWVPTRQSGDLATQAQVPWPLFEVWLVTA